MTWYYTLRGERQGPVTREELEALVRAGEVGPDELAWTSGLPQWTAVRELDWMASDAPPPAPSDPDSSDAGPTPPEASDAATSAPDMTRRPPAITLLAVQLGTNALIRVVGVAFLLSGRGRALADFGMARFIPGTGATMLAFAVLLVVAAVGLLTLRPFGRVLAIGVAVLGLVSVPFGTLMSIATLVILLNPAVAVLFSPQRRRDPSPDDARAVADFRAASWPTQLAAVILCAKVLILLVSFRHLYP